jgi:hypothetical protein
VGVDLVVLVGVDNDIAGYASTRQMRTSSGKGGGGGGGYVCEEEKNAQNQST